jgi:hypothetical protein
MSFLGVFNVRGKKAELHIIFSMSLAVAKLGGGLCSPFYKSGGLKPRVSPLHCIYTSRPTQVNITQELS